VYLKFLGFSIFDNVEISSTKFVKVYNPHRCYTLNTGAFTSSVQQTLATTPVAGFDATAMTAPTVTAVVRTSIVEEEIPKRLLITYSLHIKY
jgi:hypothetical protein